MSGPVDHTKALPVSTCLMVYVALLGLTAITVGAAFLDMSFLNTPVALGIASAKALLVMYFFMELRHSERINWVVMGSGGVFLAIMFLLTMSDVVSRGWLGVPGK
ncbi:MAG: cytochrome C oxidase subunit IV family protein [Candidatus Binatia bacterium]